MKSIGFKDKTYYYSNKVVLGLSVTLDRNIDRDKFSNAFYKMLEKHPYLKVRPVLSKGIIYYEENNNPVPVVPYEKLNGIRIGTDQTNGFPFVFSITGKKFTMLLSHAVADYYGITLFLDSLLCFLAIEYGLEIGKEQLEQLKFEYQECDDTLNPYKIYGKEDAKPYLLPFNHEDVLLPTASVNERSHSVEFSFNAEEYIKYIKENEASFVPMLVDIISTALEKKDGDGAKLPVASVVGNVRHLFNSKCVTNFIENAILPSSGYKCGKTAKERAENYKAILKEQLDVENVQYLVNKKIDLVKAIETGNTSEQNESRMIPSYALSYVGKDKYTNSLNGFVEGYEIFPAIPTSPSLFVVVFAKADSILVQLLLSGDVKSYAKCIIDELNQRGISTTKINSSSFPTASFDIKEFKRV